MSKHPKQMKNRLRVSWLFFHPQYNPQVLVFSFPPFFIYGHLKKILNYQVVYSNKNGFVEIRVKSDSNRLLSGVRRNRRWLENISNKQYELQSREGLLELYSSLLYYWILIYYRQGQSLIFGNVPDGESTRIFWKVPNPWSPGNTRWN